MENPTTKTCRRCDSPFTGKRCQVCATRQHAKWVEENRETAREQNNRSRSKHRDKRVAEVRACWDKNRDQYNEQKRERHRLHPEIKQEVNARPENVESRRRYDRSSKRAQSRKQYRQANKERILELNRFSHVKRTYGLTAEEYLALLTAQSNCCAICERSFDETRIYVDHCHVTNIVRGLLCLQCNVGLGAFKDDIERLAGAISYLRSHQSA